MFRKCLWICLGLALPWSAAAAGELPGWWRSFCARPSMESAFVQESESAVFGKLTRQGELKLAQGGRLRVEYLHGIVLVADGRTLTQYDPAARTAQRILLRSAAADTPLLNVLLNPAMLDKFYQAKAGPGQGLVLEPRRQALPRVELTGKGGLPDRISWTDGTGASQVIQFKDARVPAQPFDPSIFVFAAPDGTRWLGESR
jgi:outer membrane lipoprotein-sorting protein